MKLEEIGFYTLFDKRAHNVSIESDLQRCELILTHRCNFKCAYCRGISDNYKGDLLLEDAKKIIDLWSNENLHNVRFSGGEPTIYKNIVDLVKYTKKKKSIEHIAISTNGSASLDLYYALYDSGVNDFSISLDACCSMTSDIMAGCHSHFGHISNVIRKLSKLTYVTVGVVIDDRNAKELINIIQYATELGVSDIRIIPSAQSDKKLEIDIETEYRILKYRLNNIRNNRHTRGLSKTDCHKCHLVKDDMIIANRYHFPCIIYFREQGDPIGLINSNMRRERFEWFDKMNTYEDTICKNNCLDVCIDYNNRVEKYQIIGNNRELLP